MSDAASDKSEDWRDRSAGSANVSIEVRARVKEKGLWGTLVASQAFWVTIALVVICVI